MTIDRQNPHWTRTLPLGAALLLGGSSCLALDVSNRPPEAEVEVSMNGTLIDPTQLITYQGTPIAFTLDATPSSDPDGQIVEYFWMDPSLTYPERCAAAGIPEEDCQNMPPPITDYPPQPTIEVTLEPGTHRFSVWVTDDAGDVSAPATVTLTIAVFDAACVSEYTGSGASQACAECVCTPSDMSGCLDLYNACFGSADPDFVMHCLALVECAAETGCSGTACYEPDACMAEIDMSSMYAGETALTCSSGDPTMNPCSAATQFGACRANNCAEACTL